MTFREKQEKQEKANLSRYAFLSENSGGRSKAEPECEIRTAFQRDRDRIIHSKSFRRLKHKTQVFLSPEGDHYRTRLTHTLEVSQIARTISRALGLNEDLTEAIALSHDLGHTPFGHAGEKMLDSVLSVGFKHYQQSLRVVDKLEKNGEGLNLTFEVRNGIVNHSKGKGNIFKNSKDIASMEAEVVRISDIIAYVNHDIDDAIRAGFIKLSDLPGNSTKVLGEKHSVRIGRMVKDVIANSIDARHIKMSDSVHKAILELRDFLFSYVYETGEMFREFEKAKIILEKIYNYVYNNPEEYLPGINLEDSLERRTADFIAGMTDRYAMNLYKELFLPVSFYRS